MALNFPDSPIPNELFTSGGSSWRYNADLNAWESQPVSFPAWDDLTGTLNDLQFNLAPGGTISAGDLRWDPAEGCLAYGVEGGDISIGKEMWDTYTDLTAGGDLADGQAVSVVGVSGNRQAVGRTDPTSLISSRAFIGLVTNKNANGTVRVTMMGKVHSLNTLGMTEGGLVYVGPTAGSFTQTPPAAPSLTIVVGVVEVANRNNGIINVQPRLLPRLQDLSDVNGTPLSVTGQIPVWNQTLKVFDYTSNILTLTSSNLTDATTVGRSFFALANPSAITFPRINANNTVTALTASAFVTAIGASPAAGSSSITTVGTITSGVWNGSAVPVANGGTGGTTASVARTNLGATTAGGNLFTVTNPSAVTFIRLNADNTVSTRTASELKTDLTLNNVENTALSTWTGSTNITTVGTLGSLTVTSASLAASTPINLNQTWNNVAVTFEALTLNVTDTASAAASLLLNLKVGAASKLSVDKGGAVVAAGHLAALTKSFRTPDVDHPGHLLQYGCLEGPEHGVYVRGRSASSLIDLPPAWRWLVDPDSLTVQLTPSGRPADLYVLEVVDNQIRVGGVVGPFFYLVHGRRQDVPPLELNVEVEL